MKTVADIRRENLDLLAENLGAMERVAEVAETSPVYLSQIKNQTTDSKTQRPRQMGSQLARKLEQKFGKPTGWMDQDHKTKQVEKDSFKRYEIDSTKIRPVWVVGKTMGGLPERIWSDSDYPVGDLHEYAEEASCDPSAFLCEVVGTSMLERYNPGEFALVEPNTPIQSGDDVLVRLLTGETMLKRLDLMQSGYRLRSLNGNEQYFFSEAEISWIYYVAHPVPRRRIKTRH